MDIFESADKYLGIPYVLGGDGTPEGGMDCGLFTQMAYGDIGVVLNSRCADDQAAQMQNGGKFDESFDTANKGDLIFFKNTYGDFPEGTITHVAILAEDNKLLQACSSKGVAYTDNWDCYWKDFFAGVGHIG